MRKFAVIGLGRFGARLSANLAAAGQEVIAIDQDTQIVEKLRDRVTLAVALDCTDEQALQSQGVDQVDAAVVCIGDDFETNVLATRILKDIGVKRVISRAVTPTMGRVLTRVGADELVNPEDESADRWATRLVSPQVLNQFELASGHSVVEIGTPKAWVGKTLTDLRLRSEMAVHVVAIRRVEENGRGPVIETLQLPMPDEPLRAQDGMILLGRDADLARLPQDER